MYCFSNYSKNILILMTKRMQSAVFYGFREADYGFREIFCNASDLKTKKGTMGRKLLCIPQIKLIIVVIIISSLCQNVLNEPALL